MDPPPSEWVGDKRAPLMICVLLSQLLTVLTGSRKCKSASLISRLCLLELAAKLGQLGALSGDGEGVSDN